MHAILCIMQLVLHHVRNGKPKSAIDYLIYFFVFTTPLFEIPQAYLIYSNQDASDVSVLTWSYFSVSSVAWVTYGVRKRIKPVIFAYSLYLVIETTIVVGIFRYG
jgi:uncharacterized protein with PQ loop repeat